MSETASKKVACRGSCHCGHTQYVIFLTLPYAFSESNVPKRLEQEIYRCNCSACHKMGFLHVNPAHARNDFMLLSPLNPDDGLKTYLCNSMKAKYYFCPKCGVRCFTFIGVGEIETVDLSGLGIDKEGETKVWRAVWDGELDTEPYMSINGHTIDYRDDLDFRTMTEEKRIMYLDDRTEPLAAKKKTRWDRPHYGGCY